jgi:hypothetical protein
LVVVVDSGAAVQWCSGAVVHFLTVQPTSPEKLLCDQNVFEYLRMLSRPGVSWSSYEGVSGLVA